MSLITMVRYVNDQAGKIVFKSIILFFLASTGVRKIDLLGISIPLYEYIYLVKKMKGAL